MSRDKRRYIIYNNTKTEISPNLEDGKLSYKHL